METHQLAKRLLRAFRAHQRLAQFIGSAYGTELNTTEGSILIELEEDAHQSVVTLAEILQLNKATISRSIKSLVDLRYLSSRESSTDARRLELKILKKGHEFLEVHHQQTNELVSNLRENLANESAAMHLAQFLKIFADADGAPPSIGSPGNIKNRILMPILVEMRRLARSHGITGNSFMDSEHSSTTWQILSCLTYDPPPHRPSMIAQLLSLKGNTVSQILKRFAEQGWVSNQRQDDDGRMRDVEILMNGRKVLAHIEAVACARIEKCLEAITPEGQAHFVELFEQYVGIRSADGSTTGIRKDQVRYAQNDIERQQYRAFVVEEAVRMQLHYKLPYRICAPDNLLYSLWDDGHCRAVIELSAKPEARISWIGASREVIQSARFLSFFIEAVRKASKQASIVYLDPPVLELLPVKLSSLVVGDALYLSQFEELEIDAAVSQIANA